MSGGNSRQRRKSSRAAGKPAAQVVASSADPTVVVKSEKTIPEKLLDFFEHTWVIAALCTIGTLVGFLYTPILAICGIAILLAFHRVGVVRGKSWAAQIAAYGILFAATSSLLYAASAVIKRNLPHVPTATEVANAVVSALSHQEPPRAEAAPHTIPQSAPSDTPPPDIKYPPPKGPLQKIEGTRETPSTEMCVGLPDADQIKCLCPRPLKYALTALPAPSDNNYATKLDIRAVREPIYKLRIFSRTVLSSGKLEAFPYGEGQAAIVVEEFDYDRYSLIVQSTRPENRFIINVESAQGLRLKCIDQEN
jgi:hypothetical protein